MTVANSPPTTPTHHGAQGGSESASNQPVSSAEPSRSVDATGSWRRRRQNASPRIAEAVVIHHR